MRSRERSSLSSRQRERSRSPIRGSGTYTSYRDRDRDIPIYVTYEGIYNSENVDTPIIYTPFTFGMEWELVSRYDVGSLKEENKYDRAEIYTSKNLKVTIEDYKIEDYYKNLTSKQKSNSCKYNLEISIGVLGKNPPISLGTFLENNEYFIPQIEENLEDFSSFFSVNPNIRQEYDRNFNDDSVINSDIHFTDCSLRQRFEDKYKDEQYPYFYQKGPSFIKDSNGILRIDEEGRPQITLGLSYALFTPLLNFFSTDEKIVQSINIYNFILQINKKNYDNININSKLVSKGFGMLILYYSLVASEYAQNDIAEKYQVRGYTYFKSAFALKPRSNLAESYKFLKEEYPEITEYLKNIYDAISFILEDSGIYASSLNNYDSLVNFHLQVIKSYIEENEEIKKIEEKHDDITDKYQEIFSYIKSIDSDLNIHKRLLLYITLINAHYLINNIFNPKKVVKLKFDRKKIKKGCKILDGYYYSYEGTNKDLINELVSKKYVTIINNRVYDYAHTSDPPVLLVERDDISKKIKWICSERREELFEYIPEDSNLILEIRLPEVFTQNYKAAGLEFINIPSFLREFFLSISEIFKNFLDQSQPTQQTTYRQPSHPTTYQQPTQSGCYLMFRHKNKRKSTRKNKRKSNKSKRKSKKSIRKSNKSIRKSKRKSKKSIRKSKRKSKKSIRKSKRKSRKNIRKSKKKHKKK